MDSVEYIGMDVHYVLLHTVTHPGMTPSTEPFSRSPRSRRPFGEAEYCYIPTPPKR
jgi:hypothetical protein